VRAGKVAAADPCSLELETLEPDGNGNFRVAPGYAADPGSQAANAGSVMSVIGNTAIAQLTIIYIKFECY